MCERYNCLPQDGGLLDQNNLTVRKLLLVSQARAERAERDRKKREAEQKRNSKKGKR